MLRIGTARRPCSLPSPSVAGATLVLAITLVGSVLAAPDVKVLYRFPALGPVTPVGTLLHAADGNFYGVSTWGGAGPGGTIFRMTPDAVVTVLHSFRMPPTTSRPNGTLLQAADGSLYGTMTWGHRVDPGIVFRITTAGAFSVLDTFDTGDYCDPQDGLIQASDGYIYGTAVGCGAPGAVFRLGPSGDVQFVYEFTGGVGPAGPRAGLIEGLDGSFYGTTRSGGPSNLGTVFRMTMEGDRGRVDVLHAFTNGGADGAAPAAALVQAEDGTLYGTTSAGGTGAGVIFEIAPGTGFRTLHNLVAEEDGAQPSALVLHRGSLYGTTAAGGAGDAGTVFRLAPQGTFTLLHSFATSDGASPRGGLTPTPGGSLYGTASAGGELGHGTAFEITPSDNFVLRGSFNPGPWGANPTSVVRARDGNLYGTTQSGGSQGGGTIVRITPTGEVTVFHSGGAAAPLVEASDGNFYGTTGSRMFRLTPAGTYTVLHELGPKGPSRSGLIQAADGYLYGTLYGTADKGAVFRMSLTGEVTVLHTFTGPDGARPQAPLIQAGDGNFYGTTSQGGGFNRGTVFRMTPTGSLITLHAFAPNPDGDGPTGRLLEAPDGFLYGTTRSGGALSGGTIFRLARTGDDYATLHPLGGYASHPLGGVVRGADGSLYGVGSNAVYRLAPHGALDILGSFDLVDGFQPTGELTEAAPGHFYGVTTFGGSEVILGMGVVFHFGVFSDDPLVASATPIRAAHITELRARVDAARRARGLAPYQYLDDPIVIGVTALKARHIVDLRDALREVYLADARTPPVFADPDLVAGMTPRVAHVAEIREALLAIE